jgi:hypothetical protein
LGGDVFVHYQGCGRTVTYMPHAAGRSVSAIDHNGTPSVTTDDVNYATVATDAHHPT